MRTGDGAPRLSWTAILLIGAALGCADSEPQLTLGDQCDLTSQCEAPLVCRIGRCRLECATVRDCPAGSLCVTDSEGLGACTLPDEDRCDLSSECPEPLVCRMGRCTNSCGDDRDCPPGAQCEGDGTEAACVDPTEEECEVESDCPAPLVCAVDRRCREECRTSRDCRAGAVCQDGQCVRDTPGTDGGTDGGVDSGAAMDASTADAGVDAGAVDAGDAWDASWIWRDASYDAGWDGALPECSGFCSSAPNATVECISGRCTITGCTAPWADCNGVGVDGCETNTDTHRDHCSACGTACGAGQACLAGVCVGATVTSVDVGRNFACAAWSTGEVTCWGANHFGQLGYGGASSVARPVPVMVSGLADVQSVDAEWLTACAVKTDGTVWCWGHNTYGQLGDGTTTHRDVPTQVSGLTDATAVAVGQFTTCALRTGGAVSCWGQNSQGQVGNGTAATSVTTPAAVTGLTDATQVSAGTTSCAMRSTGEAVCWGQNDTFQIDDTSTPRYTPTAVSSFADEGFTPAFVRGGTSVVVATTDGRAACRGPNGPTSFACGIGTAEGPVSPPVAQPGVTEAVAADGTCWMTSSGGVMCWGTLNENGAAGIGRAEHPHAAPVSAVGISDVAEVGSSGEVTCVRTGSGEVHCTGSGAATGDGSGGTRYTFRKVEGTP